MKEKYINCKFCKKTLEVHHISLHEKQCYLKPENLQKICNYLLSGIEDNKKLQRASFYRWAQKEKILTSISITNRMGLPSWNHALYQLLVYGYLFGFIDYEYVEVILYIVSNSSLWMNKEEYKKAYQDSLQREYKNKKIEDTFLYSNNCLLLLSIILRAKRDLTFNRGDYDENKELVDIDDACQFVASFCPEIIDSCNLSEDASLVLHSGNLYQASLGFEQ